MPLIIAPGVIFTVGSPPLKIRVGRKVYDFEDHKWCGPVALNKHGDAAKAQPMKFLHAASVWIQTGRRIAPTGLCIWCQADGAGG